MRSQVMILLALASVMMVAVDYTIAESRYCGMFSHPSWCKSCCTEVFSISDYEIKEKSCYCNDLQSGRFQDAFATNLASVKRDAAYRRSM